ncbi:DUF3079 domain-containing protein [Pseudomonas sp. GOM7]|uniref:DUF3079 domain-containing protein n=1 Tax=Pseudomonas sp. GOM7 TaxID=2998079 RepID=UPI00227A2F59|nr:DUF3079 domain-containing protein [Pseudomonas sp. GOM7]WAJ39146.1 DUF3079 domain-containing protein [Pseudomonas sp. GOM7]
MSKKFPLLPKHPERVCWGCDRYCPATDLACGNGADRTMHPVEMLGDDWYLDGDWGFATPENPNDVQTGETSPPPATHHDT